jgi:hypothetical protein
MKSFVHISVYPYEFMYKKLPFWCTDISATYIYQITHAFPKNWAKTKKSLYLDKYIYIPTHIPRYKDYMNMGRVIINCKGGLQGESA